MEKYEIIALIIIVLFVLIKKYLKYLKCGHNVLTRPQYAQKANADSPVNGSCNKSSEPVEDTFFDGINKISPCAIPVCDSNIESNDEQTSSDKTI